MFIDWSYGKNFLSLTGVPSWTKDNKTSLLTEESEVTTQNKVFIAPTPELINYFYDFFESFLSRIIDNVGLWRLNESQNAKP